ncbi:ISAs1 family transposase [Tenacibaculum finnmarkense]|nr:ISAs1 family transposase [Tenacibaculum finnmarkense]MCG8814149.1 ISAs1 family transposase [Tenacibaculum finnmarkense]MCG8859954.1 ISAs1 family transposase [Tenacibaculum finnmarkense]
MNSNSKLVSVFGNIEDPRSDINKLHNLVDILLIGIISVICGAETWKQMVEFACSKEEFLRKFLELPNGIPSEDTINRVFSAIDSAEFETCFIEWVNSISMISKGQVIAIDGKTIRGAKSNGKKSPVHMVSAWADQNNLVLGQIRVNEKSNEITAIPELLDTLCVAGNIITIDAMGTQTNIADKIIDNDANYILAVKGNQKQLLEEIKDEFKFSNGIEIDTNIDLGHGRIETRKCSVISNFKFIQNTDNKWNSLSQVIKIESIREFKNSDKLTEKATRYYISSLKDTAVNHQGHIRSHWGVENKLHWTLDVAFSEDASRKRNKNAAQNYSILLKIALNLLKNEKTEKQGIAGKRLKAGWNEAYLLKVLNIKV